MATKYKKQNDGRYQARVWDGTYMSDNSKHYVRLYSDKSSKDLENKVNCYKRAIEDGKVKITSDIPFFDYAKEWLRTYKSVRERGTQIMYENIIKKHLSEIKHVKISEITRMHFQLSINRAIDSPRICQQIKITFQQIIKSAIADKLLPMIAYEDICGNIEVPRYSPSEKRALTSLEKKAIQVADFTDRERIFVMIAYGCGLRRGEILALTVFDVCLERAELTVNKSLAFDCNNSYIKGTKSANGERVVPIPPFLFDILSGYLKTLSGTSLFSKLDGTIITMSSYRKMWESILKKINTAAGGNDTVNKVPGLTAHVFRHNYCANLCYQMPDISIKRIARLLGDTEKMVLEVYNHVLEEKENVQEVVANAMSFEDGLKTEGVKKCP